MSAPALEALTADDPVARSASTRRYLVCSPSHFQVVYAINPWMDPTRPADTRRAISQWEELVATYRGLGHGLAFAPAVPGLPDMVFAANAGLVVDGVAIGARYATAVREGEAAPYRRALVAAGYPEVRRTRHVNEGEGDLLVVGDVILAGTGFRTDARAHAEVATLTGRQVVTLHLVDPRYYHLDTALAVLEGSDGVSRDGTPLIAYLPEAFAPDSRTELEQRYPDAIQVSAADAAVLGLNAVSDGRNVVLNREAEDLAADLEARGFVPVPVDLSELRKAGGGPKCCTLELRPEHEATELRPEHEATELRPEHQEVHA